MKLPFGKIRTLSTKKLERKYYLTMLLQEAYKIYTKLPVSYEVKFYKFCDLRPENVLLLKQSPVGQCKCILHENFFIDLKALSIFCDSSSFWDTCFMQ